jgi:hypothetical protein
VLGYSALHIEVSSRSPGAGLRASTSGSSRASPACSLPQNPSRMRSVCTMTSRSA